MGSVLAGPERVIGQKFLAKNKNNNNFIKINKLNKNNQEIKEKRPIIGLKLLVIKVKLIRKSLNNQAGIDGVGEHCSQYCILESKRR